MQAINEAFIEAVKNGDEMKLKAFLLRPRCDPMSKDNDGRTALMYAARGGHASCTELPIPVSDALAKDKHCTTLMWAARHRNAACAELLIPVSDSSVKDNYGDTASGGLVTRATLTLLILSTPTLLLSARRRRLALWLLWGLHAKNNRFACRKRIR